MPRLARWWPAVCAVLAYAPALASSPGRMPADTKLALYLDPSRLTTEATATFDAAQYAGWVPHQQIAYLWPTGPWYWLADTVGLPDWVAHRWWIGTVLFAAGAGVGWALRRLGFGVTAALTGALVYQLSPYVLPYVSRTSSLLLPFAGLGWIMGATLLATRDRRPIPWRWPAVIALVVATIGAVNATALIMIVPGPALMLLHARRADGISWRRLATVGVLAATACTAVSLWWISMSVVQRANGPDVLAYSESLRSVSSSSTAIESLRGLGYWLFYVRDHLGATTTASLDHLDAPAIVALGFLALLLSLLGLAFDRGPRARLGAWCVAVGTVVAVGVYPIDDPAPVVDLLGGDLDGGLALALRSSARAVPVIVFGLAIGASLLVHHAPWPGFIRRRLGARASWATAAVVGTVVLVATPSWWTASLVDPNLDRDAQPPSAWEEAARSVGAAPGAGRVLQIPGAEFGAFGWGVTVDQPLPYLTDRAVVTRDLLPLGAAPAMDLVFALDDRFQDGWFEPASLVPVSRLLGVSTIWIAGDLDVERYDTARPNVVLEQIERDSIGTIERFGSPAPVGADVIDEELLGVASASRATPPVAVVTPDRGGSTVRVGADEVVFVGSGDGVVDAAAAGVLDGTEVLLPAVATTEPADRILVTDSFRDRAHHWRTSQDVHGFTEGAGTASELLRADDADERLPVFDDVVDGDLTDDHRTVADQVGPVTARATAYGEPFAHLPEHRPAMALDGDPDTSWIVGEHADPVGERLELTVGTDAGSVDGFSVLQPVTPDDRTITNVTVSVDGSDPIEVQLDARSHSAPGQRIERAVPAGSTVSLTVGAVSAGRVNGVGFAEVDLGLGPTREWIETPRLVPELTPSGHVDVVVTRLRAEATDRWRDDPEPTLTRRVTLPASTSAPDEPAIADVRAHLRLDRRADDATLAAWFDEPAIASARLLGAPAARGAAAVDGDDSTAWVTPFGMPIGPTLSLRGHTGDATSMTLRQPAGPFSRITEVRLDDDEGSMTVAVDGDAPIALTRPLDLSSARLTITGADLATTVDRRFGDTVVLPAAIAEWDVGRPVVAPSGDIVVDCASGWLSIDGADVPVSFRATRAELVRGDAIDVSTCGEVAVSGSAMEIVASPEPGLQIDRVVASIGSAIAARDAPRAPAPTWTAPPDRDPRTVTISACPAGCWVVLGHGFNPAWRASLRDGSTLGEPTLVDANANGWWLEPFDEPVTVDFTWTAQTPVTVAVWISALTVVALIAALGMAGWSGWSGWSGWRPRRRADDTGDHGDPPAALPPPTGAPRAAVVRPGTVWRRLAVAVAVYSVAAGLFVGPEAAAVALAIGLLVLAGRRWGRSLGALVGLGVLVTIAVIGAVVVLIVWREHPFPGLNWPGRFARFHTATMLAVVSLPFALEVAGITRHLRPAPTADAPGLLSDPPGADGPGATDEPSAHSPDEPAAHSPDEPGERWFLLRRWYLIAAMVPVLLAEPGRISADTKTYLTVDPGRLLSSAVSMWDPSVGAGTVPHQNIGYLFPLGPYYWLLDSVGVPAWIAQRLIWGMLVFAAAWGACRLGRLLGWSTTMAGITGLAYGFTPYLLSYLARLSVILFPWAAMPWLIVLAMRLVRRPTWRTAAAFAALTAVVGSVNATSLVLAGLGPTVFVVTDLITRRVDLRAAVTGIAKMTALTLAVSAWWIVGLSVQGGFGLPILRFTETYRAIAGASTPAEVLRGLGYWFFYGGDRLDHWIGPSSSYTNEGWLILLGFGITMGSLLGLLVAFPRRGTFVALLATGMVVGVGGAPISSPTVYGAWFDGFASDSTVGAALRSTTRALPLVVLALGAGLGALTDRASRWLADRRALGSNGGSSASQQVTSVVTDPRLPVVAATAMLAAQIFPWFIGTMTTDSLLRDDPVPAHVEELATELDRLGDGRVLLLPGSDFAYPRAGGTIDPILPGILDRPVLYRELVPQGSQATADLLNAHERRLHDGWAEPEAWPTIARLLGATGLAVINDHQYERFRLARPGQVWPAVAGVFGSPDHAGDTVADITEIDLVDGITYADPDAVDAFPIVASWELANDLASDDPVGVTLRPVDGTIVVDGSGDGLVDLAGSGLLDLDVLARSAVRYRASLDDADVAPGSDTWWIVTDTNREQGRRWSTIGSNLGPIDPAGIRSDLDPDDGDQRLDVFGDDTDVPFDRMTVAEHRGDVALVRSSYTGSRIAYTPEDAPFRATDGDLATAWRTAVFDDARGLEFRIDLRAPVTADHVVLVQPVTGVVDRFITRARLTLDGPDGARSIDVDLTDASRTLDGQRIDLPSGPAFDRMTIEILADNLGPLASYAGRPGVGFAEVRLPGVVDDRVVRLPVTGDAPASEERLTFVMTRERIDPATQNRFAPERRLVRVFDLADDRPFELHAEVRLAAEASDALLAAAVGWADPPTTDRRVRGTTTTWAGAALDRDPRTAWITPIDDPVGATIAVPVAGGTPAALRVTVRDDERHSRPTSVTLSTGSAVAVVPVTVVDGEVVIPWPDELITTSAQEPGVVSLTIDAVDPRTADEYFSGLPQVLPTAIVELDVVDAAGVSVVSTAIERDRALAALGCRDDLLTVDGAPVSVQLDGTVGHLLDGDEVTARTCDGTPLALGVGEHRVETVPGVGTGLDVDRIVLDSAPIEAAETPAVSADAAETVSAVRGVDRPSATEVDVRLEPTSVRTWLVFEESWNPGWSATVDGLSLGDPVLVNGYANGWILEPSDDARVVELRWEPQDRVRLGIAVSLLSGFLVVGLLLTGLRRPRRPVTIDDERPTRPEGRTRAFAWAGLLVVGLLVAGVVPALCAGAAAWLTLRYRWWWSAPAVVIITIGITGAWVAVAETVRDHADSPDWPSLFSWTAPLAWIAVATVVANVVATATTTGRDRPTDLRPSGDDTVEDRDDRSDDQPSGCEAR